MCVGCQPWGGRQQQADYLAGPVPGLIVFGYGHLDVLMLANLASRDRTPGMLSAVPRL